MEIKRGINRSYKALLLMALPMYAELLLQLFVGNIDQIMVGKLDTNGVGAIGNVNQIISLVIVTFSVASTSSIILISRYLGQKEERMVKETYRSALVISAILGASVGSFLWFLGDNMLLFIGVKGEMLVYASSYLRIISMGIPIQALNQSFIAFLRSKGLMKETFMISLGINVVNVLGNYLLIDGNLGFPSLGVSGAALASTIARFVGLILSFLFFYHKMSKHYKFLQVKICTFYQTKKILRLGLPSAGESISFGLSQLCVQVICNGFTDYMINTRVYVGMLSSCAFIGAEAISQAGQVMVSWLLGSGEIQDIRKVVKKSVLLSVIFSGGVAGILYLLCNQIFYLFTTDTQIISLAKMIMLIEIPRAIGRAINVNMCRILPACDDIFFPIGVSIMFAWMFGVGVGFFLGVSLELQVIGLWIAMAMDEIIRASLFICRWNSKKWKESYGSFSG